MGETDQNQLEPSQFGAPIPSRQLKREKKITPIGLASYVIAAALTGLLAVWLATCGFTAIFDLRLIILTMAIFIFVGIGHSGFRFSLNRLIASITLFSVSFGAVTMQSLSRGLAPPNDLLLLVIAGGTFFAAIGVLFRDWVLGVAIGAMLGVGLGIAFTVALAVVFARTVQ